MARSKNQNTYIGRRLTAVFLIVISLLLSIIAVNWFRVNSGNSELIDLKVTIKNTATSFNEVEAEYSYLVLTIFSTRSSVPDQTIDQIETKYLAVQQEYTKLAQRTILQELPDNLLATVERKLQNMQTLRNVNTLLLVEEEIGTNFSLYQTCKEKISYTKTPAVILEKLALCKKSLDAAIELVPRLPAYSTADCATLLRPNAILTAFSNNHELLATFYQLSAKHKTTASIAAEQAYQNSLRELQKKPSWNYCITRYLETEGQVLLQ